MVNESVLTESARRLVEEHLPMARTITKRLGRRFYWVPKDDLYSYSLSGLTLAARAYQPERGLSFERFAATKATFLAVDAMRMENVIWRRGGGKRRRPVCVSQLSCEQQDQAADPVEERSDTPAELLAKKDLLAGALGGLKERDRQLLLLRYSDGLTLKEIGQIQHLSESAICLRHKALIAHLRSQVDRA